MKKVRIVTSSAKNEIEFRRLTLLGHSLSLFPKQVKIELSVISNNFGSTRRGLSAIYNMFLQPQYENEILLLIHDDVYLHDWNIAHRLNDAIERFDVVGLAGNANPDFSEPSWMLAWDRAKYPTGRQPSQHFSGAVGHLVNGRTELSYYGETPRECRLLDGLFLAINTRKILEESIRFDEQFEFHFYDLDFCRQCLAKGLKLGTWPISVTHVSGGSFNSPEWISGKEKYLTKWR